MTSRRLRKGDCGPHPVSEWPAKLAKNGAEVAEDQDKSRPAGGYATQRGINYQNRVAAYFAACSLAERVALPGIPTSPLKSIRCETGEPLADILLTLEDESFIFVEVKRAMEFGAVRMRPLVSHLVEQYLASKQGTSGGKFPWRRRLDPTRDRLLLITSSEASARLTQHLSACLSRVHAGMLPKELEAVPLNDLERESFESFLVLLKGAWKTVLGENPEEDQVVELLSLFRVAVLDVNTSEPGEQNAEDFLKQTVLAPTDDAAQCWAVLIDLMGRASESRMFVTREELRRELRSARFTLASTPSYRNDIKSLRAYTELTLDSLDYLATLVVDQREIRIERPVTKYLRQQAEKQSLVVIGDPGAGKSGVLHELATVLQRENEDVVFLAADRLDDSLRAELGLDYELAEVLENWSGDRPGVLLIDALDAARGSGALQVLRDLIRRVATTQGSRWRVVASIRVFDLRYSQDLQRIFRRQVGEPGPQQFQDSTFSVRHIKVPRFSPQELNEIRAQSPELDSVFRTANPSLLELLDIPFNLRLVAELLSESEARADLGGIDTQVGLLDKYWLNRVIRSGPEGNVREAVLTEIVAALVRERKLTIAKAHILSTTKDVQFSLLCSDSVIVEQIANLHGRNIIGFSHHLLFDYAVSRLVIASDFGRFLEAVAQERDLSLFLRPSIDLFFKEAWLKHRDTFWSNLLLFSSGKDVPAIAKIIGPAVIPELAKIEVDLIPLVNALRSVDPRDKAIAEQWIIHTVGAVLADVPIHSLELWSEFCFRITQTKPSLMIAALCQSLIDHILERSHVGASNTRAGSLSLNRAAVYLLDLFASGRQREGWVVGRCILNVMDLFWADPAGSAFAIRKLITPEEIREHGAQQGHWIARKVPNLFDLDPQLAADIFTALFGYSDRSEEKTSMGGSRILAMTSNRRQDYHQAHWQLAQHFTRFLEKHFALCKPIIIAAAENVIDSEHRPRSIENAISYEIGGAQHVVLVDYSAIWDSSGVREEALAIADAYFRKLEELARSASTIGLARATAMAFLEDAQYAYFLRKVLILARNSGPALAEVVYPLLSSPTALWSYDLSSLIGEVLQTNYVGLDRMRREHIEAVIVNLTEGENDPDRLAAMGHIRDKLLWCIPADLLVLPQSLCLITELAEDGRAPENGPPYVSHGFGVSQYSADDIMRDRGIPIEELPNAMLRDRAKRLWEFAQKFHNGTPNQSDVAGIDEDIDEVWKILGAGSVGVHEEVASSAEAELLAACATAAKMKSLDCSSPFGTRIRTILFAGLDSPRPEYDPKYDKQWDESPSGWGSPVQRIEAAEGIGSLLSHRRCVDESLLVQVRRAITDPVPAVRFQTIVRLLPLHDKNIDALWSLLSVLVREEPRAGVLSGAFYAVINPLAGRYKAEVVALIRDLLDRTDLAKDGGEAFEWGHRIATGLYIYQGDASAFSLIRPILEGDLFRPRYAGQCLRDIREALSFSSDVPKAADSEVRKRAFGLVELTIRSITTLMNHMIHEIDVNDRDETWQEGFQELARLVDNISNQLYFSSGAYDGTNSHKKMDDDARRRFWEESQQVILQLSKVAIPSAAHHLIETLQGFIPIEPIAVFHSIAAVVRSAKSWGYQYESLAVDLLVNVTENYIAEHRMELQKDRQSREELIDILETFVEAGWPSARRLSYRLEEIFR
jgi:hypothetical protein